MQVFLLLVRPVFLTFFLMFICSTLFSGNSPTSHNRLRPHLPRDILQLRHLCNTCLHHHQREPCFWHGPVSLQWTTIEEFRLQEGGYSRGSAHHRGNPADCKSAVIYPLYHHIQLNDMWVNICFDQRHLIRFFNVDFWTFIVYPVMLVVCKVEVSAVRPLLQTTFWADLRVL